VPAARRDMPLIFERSRPGRRGIGVPKPGLPIPRVPPALARAAPPRLPELAEPEVLRHFTELSTRNFGVDTGFYPLGSCTMKYNPRVNERLAGLPGFRDLHPLADDEVAQGALELEWELERILRELTGLDAVSLQPAAGSQGELTGLLLMRAYFDDRGEQDRRRIVIPDTAHGTNPASVTMAGYELTKVATDERGNVDLDDLRSNVDERTAGLMLTNPSTLGLFDENIEAIREIFHGAGALMYYDGANLNAVCGISRPGDMGFDIVHINLHKTFSQPHGGGGPGGGPIAVREILAAYLPVPVVAREGGAFRLDFDRPKSIGKVRGYSGPFGVFVRSYAFMRAWGPALREMSEVAVLNANYLLARVKDAYDLPFDRLCMHEFVLSARTLKREHGISALDVAKRLMDFGFHPPTVYFPLVVAEALMVEPTETEAKETLDAFADALVRIAKEAQDDPDAIRTAPHGAPVGRLDEVRAAKQAVVRYRFDEHAHTAPSDRRPEAVAVEAAAGVSEPDRDGAGFERQSAAPYDRA
jgi:glycine dehydrogenase subunit 2